jgi:hypothetical protein
VEYKIGQDAMAVSAREYDFEPILNKMDRGQHWMFYDGKNAEGTLGRFDELAGGGSFMLQTNDKSFKAGKQPTALMACNSRDNLLSILFKPSFVESTLPKFKTKMTSKFSL